MLRRLAVAAIFGIFGLFAYMVDRFSVSKELLMTPALLVALVIFGLGLAFAYVFDTRNKMSFVRMGIFIAIAILSGVFYSAISDAWPAEPSNVHRDALPVEPVNSLPEVENWQVLEEYTDFNGLIVSKVHQDPNDPNKLGFTMWFPNKDKSYVLEVFVRMVDFIKNGEKTDASRVKGIIKLQNGNWSEMVAVDKILRSEGLLNGKPAIIFRAVDDNGETKFFRAFLLKDLVKPKK